MPEVLLEQWNVGENSCPASRSVMLAHSASYPAMCGVVDALGSEVGEGHVERGPAAGAVVRRVRRVRVTHLSPGTRRHNAHVTSAQATQPKWP